MGRNDQTRRQELYGAEDLEGRRWRSCDERDSHLRRGRPSLYRKAELSWPVHARISKVEIQLQSPRGWPATRRSLRGQRRLEPDESVGEILRGRHGISKHPDLRRQRHLDGILGAHEQGHEQRKWFREVSDQ